MPADPGIDQGHARLFQRLGHGDYLGAGIAAFYQVQQRQAVHDDKTLAHRGAHALHDFHRQPHPVFNAAAPAILPMIGARRQELVEQITFAAHDFDAVVVGALRQRGTAHIGCDGGLDTALGQCARFERGNRRLDGRS